MRRIKNFKRRFKRLRAKFERMMEEREKRLELNRTNTEKRRKPIDNKQHGLQKDIKNIAEEKERKIGQLEISLQDDTSTTETTIKILEKVLEDD